MSKESLHLFLLIALFISTISGRPAIAQESNLVFEKSVFDQNLIYEPIEDLLIDSDGFTWLATPSGLHVYDGYDFTTFFPNINVKSSISENYITTLFEDSRGLIWIGTFKTGLNVYNKELDSFDNLRNDPSNNATLSTDRIPRVNHIITEDNDGYIWVNTDNALNRIDPGTYEVERHTGDLSGQIIYDDGVFWIAGSSLRSYNPETKTLSIHEYPDGQMTANALELSQNGLLWIGTNSGLYLFDRDDNSFAKTSKLFEQSGQSFKREKDPIDALYEDVQGNMWVARKRSILVLDPNNGNHSELKYIPGKVPGMLNEDIRKIYGDDKGTVLVTYNAPSITKINISKNNFRRITNFTEDTRNGNEGIVRSILVDRHDNLWVGTYYFGISRIMKGNMENIRSFRYEAENPQSLNSNYITAIHIDKGDRLWVGTFQDGFNFADNIYRQQDLQFHSSDFEGEKEIHKFFEDQAGRIWISTDSGFYIYDKDKEELQQYGLAPNQDPKLQTINIQATVQESANVFWLATWDSGIIKFEINSDVLLSDGTGKDTLQIFDQNKDQSGYVLANRFINIIKGSSGIFWLASSVDGLIKMELHDGEPHFTRYDKSKGAPSNRIYAIVEDNSGNIWISSRNGIGKFNPQTEIFINYRETDGILSNSLIWDAYSQDKSGEILFGGVNGITAFNPDSIAQTDPIREAYISQLTINHGKIGINDTVNGRVILEKDIRFAETLELTHLDKAVSFHFKALNVSDANEISFEYQLLGFDDDWIYAAAEDRVATYTNLNSGIYTFKVRATKNFGVWGEDYTSLQVVVIPPWWRTWWAYALYVIIFLLLLYLLNMELVNRAELNHKLELETYKHERDNELNKEKFKFFTTLSHEFRTPLTLILGPIDRMIRKNEANNRVQKNLLLIRNQALRLQKLTNQLMNLRKYETENLKLKAAEGNIVAFMNEMSLAFRQHAKMNHIYFHFECTDKQIPLYFDRDKLEIIVVNLISNAFKFTPPEGTVNLKLKQATADAALKLENHEDAFSKAMYGDLTEGVKNLVQIEVSDTGIGIKQEQIEHVFERYFQANNIETFSKEGTGIGLEVVKNYVELHHGSLMVKSKEGVGSTFYVWLPMGRLHLSERDIIQDFKPSEHEDHYKGPAKKITAKFADVLTVEEKEEINEQLSTILIVDDNPDIVSYLKENFEDSFNTITARNGKIGLEMAIDHMPDLIISDIMMPEMDGLEFCKKIKGEIATSHIPVILLTARTSDVFQAEGLETGADDYITKPFDEKILNIRVKNLIDSRKKLRERYSKEVTLMPRDITITKPDENLLDRVIEIIEDNISDNDLKVEWIARELGMSHSILYKKVMALTDLSIVEFVRTIRLKKASMLLSKTDFSVSEVSHEVGFTDPKYFSKCFQKLFGTTPSSYRKESA